MQNAHTLTLEALIKTPYIQQTAALIKNATQANNLDLLREVLAANSLRKHAEPNYMLNGTMQVIERQLRCALGETFQDDVKAGRHESPLSELAWNMDTEN